MSQSCCVQAPLCPSHVVFQTHCVPDPLCPSPVVSQSCCAQALLCPSPVVSKPHYVPVLCPIPIMFQSCVQTPLCPSPESKPHYVPVLCLSLIMSQSCCVQTPLCPSPVSKPHYVPVLLCPSPIVTKSDYQAADQQHLCFTSSSERCSPPCISANGREAVMTLDTSKPNVFLKLHLVLLVETLQEETCSNTCNGHGQTINSIEKYI